MNGRKETAPVVQTWREYLPPAWVDEVDANTRYEGYAQPGVDPDKEGWRIIRYTKDGTVTKAEYPRGDFGFHFVWDDRASYHYGR